METTLDTIKNLRIHQHKQGYRFSMDAVLLADFVKVRSLKRAADFGAGSGVVGLFLARRFPKAHVTLIELQDGLHKLSLKNIRANELDNVTAIRADVRKLGPELKNFIEGLDLVVSNPPFRKPLSGLRSEVEERAIARHEMELSLQELLRAASRALRPGGRLCMVYLPERLADVFEGMRGLGLEPKRLRLVHGRQGAEARVALIEAGRLGRPGLKVEPPLFVYRDASQTYSDEVLSIYE